MTGANAQDFNDETYSKESIRAYEFAFGKGYISTGGAETNEIIVKSLGLKSGDYVLDIGCGIGGSAFYMASIGAKVHGVDFSTNMIAIANQYLEEQPDVLKSNVTFERNDILLCDFEPNTFDVIYSRDVILHIEGKEKLFGLIYKWLKPSGLLMFTDICEGDIIQHTDLYQKYIDKYRLALYKTSEYKQLIEKVGFSDVTVANETKECLRILNKEFDRVKEGKIEFLNISNPEMYDHITRHWVDKLYRFGTGDNAWGHFRAIKK